MEPQNPGQLRELLTRLDKLRSWLNVVWDGLKKQRYRADHITRKIDFMYFRAVRNRQSRTQDTNTSMLQHLKRSRPCEQNRSDLPMAYKRNPNESERAASLARFVMNGTAMRDTATPKGLNGPGRFRKQRS
jgi:hypothetical protein